MSLSTSIIPSPLGDLIAVTDEHTLHLLEFADHGELSKRLAILENRLGKKIQTWENTLIKKVQEELSEYFAWKRKHFTVSLAPHGTEFQMKAWKALEQIPYGETRSYLEEATMIGSPKAVRAIGGANHANNFPILIPCHRVIGKSGKLVGYGGGIDRKIWLLDHEKKHI